MNDKKPVNLVTDQPSHTGIGEYALNLKSLLDSHSVTNKLIYLGFRKQKSLGVEHDDRLRYAETSMSVPLAYAHNKAYVRKSELLCDSWIHFLGASYNWCWSNSKVLATVHDVYFTLPRFSDAHFLRSASTQVMRDYVLWDSLRYLRRADHLVTISNVSRKELFRWTGRDSDVIHHWIDERRFHPRDKYITRRQLGLPESSKVILNVSGHGPNKGLGLLREVANSLDKDSVLVKIGAAISGEKVQNIREVPDELYPLYFNAADVYLDTSSREGFGRPLIESMGSRLPVISRRKDISIELLGNAGVYFGPNECVRDILGLFSILDSREEKEEYGSRLSERSSLFSAETSFQKYFEVYKKTFGT